MHHQHFTHIRKHWRALVGATLLTATAIVATYGFKSHADIDPNFGVTDVGSMARAHQLWSSLNRDTRSKSICANRAMVWAYDMYRNQGIQTGKVYVFFTGNHPSSDDKTWVYHVAPYVLVNGQEVVLDAGFGDIQRPYTMEEWLYRFGRGNCKVLDKLEKAWGSMYYNDLQEDCYARKVPMYYYMPMDVYDGDFNRDTDGDGITTRNNFPMGEVLLACKQALNGPILPNRKLKYCKEYFGLSDAEFDRAREELRARHPNVDLE